MFWLKKVVSLLVMPLPLVTLLLGISLFLGYRHRHHLARFALVLAMALLVFLSSSVGSRLITLPLESRYAVNSLPIEGACTVMVLGSGHEDAIAGTAVHKLSAIALARLSEGLRQLKLGNQCRLVLSGFSGGLNETSHAETMKAAAIELGVEPERILLLPDAMDTLEEARSLKALGIEHIRLVTSAAHMPRAMAMFSHEGISASAAPTDFTARSGYWWRLDARELYTSQRAIHEYVGMLWFSLRYQ